MHPFNSCFLTNSSNLVPGAFGCMVSCISLCTTPHHYIISTNSNHTHLCRRHSTYSSYFSRGVTCSIDLAAHNTTSSRRCVGMVRFGSWCVFCYGASSSRGLCWLRLVNLIFECVSDSFRYVTRTVRTLDRPVELVSDLTDFKFWTHWLVMRFTNFILFLILPVSAWSDSRIRRNANRMCRTINAYTVTAHANSFHVSHYHFHSFPSITSESNLIYTGLTTLAQYGHSYQSQALVWSFT